MYEFEVQRDDLNEKINHCRKLAREDGIPTKAVEAAIQVAKRRRKALELVSQEDFDELVNEARKLFAADDLVRQAQDLQDAVPNKIDFDTPAETT